MPNVRDPWTWIIWLLFFPLIALGVAIIVAAVVMLGQILAKGPMGILVLWLSAGVTAAIVIGILRGRS